LLLLIGNTRGTLDRNVLEPMRGIWGSELVGRIGPDGNVVLFGRKCFALGADKITQIARLQGVGLSYCYGDEVTTWHPGVFNMLKSRLDKPDSCFDGTCNPGSPRHWFKKFLDSGADVSATSFCIDDNPFLPPDFVRNLKNEYRGTVLYDRYILGRWAAAEGRIYTGFGPACVLDRGAMADFIRENPVALVVMGVDIGGNKSATSFTLAGITKGFRHAVVLDEVYDRQNAGAEHIIASFRETVLRWKDQWPKLSDCFVDSAEQLFVKSFRNCGGINVLNARKSPVNGRIQALSRLIAQGRFFVANECVHLIEALETAVWDDGEKTKDLRLDNGSVNVDSLDSMEYALEGWFSDLLRL
jgi:PBSX family phage terminase large subunit